MRIAVQIIYWILSFLCGWTEIVSSFNFLYYSKPSDSYCWCLVLALYLMFKDLKVLGKYYCSLKSSFPLLHSSSEGTMYLHKIL